MDKEIIDAIVTATTVLSGTLIGGLIVFITQRYFRNKDVEQQYKINKYKIEIENIEKVIELLSNRKAVPIHLFNFMSVDVNTINRIKEYNHLVAYLRAEIASHIRHTLITYFELDEEEYRHSSRHYKLPPVIIEIANKISELGLFEDANQLIMDDPSIGGLVREEIGGSYGNWATDLHFTLEMAGKHNTDDLQKLFSTVPGLLEEMIRLRDSLLDKSFK
jgi:hypothetical protein